jgi:hypothetical protein
VLIAVSTRVPGKHLRGQDPEDTKHLLGHPIPKPRFEPNRPTFSSEVKDTTATPACPLRYWIT